MAHDVFISYASEDKAIANAVCGALEKEGIDCWIAPRNIAPGVVYERAIIDGITASRVLVLVFSSRSDRSRHVARELKLADDRGLPFLPFRIEGVVPSGPVGFYIGSHHWLDARTPPSEADLAALVNAVQTLLSEVGSAHAGSPASDAESRAELVSAAEYEGRVTTEVAWVGPEAIQRPPDGESRRMNSLGNALIAIPRQFLAEGHSPGLMVYASATCVSNAEYLQFVKAGGSEPAWAEKYRKRRTWEFQNCPKDILDHPVLFVTQKQARQFCVWLTKKERRKRRSEGGIAGDEYYTLPTFADWTAVAQSVSFTRSIVTDRTWGQGDRPPTEHTRYGDASSIGLYCLLGNVFEWCRDEEVREIREGDRVVPRRCWLTVGAGWASSYDWLREEVRKGTYGGILCPGGWPMKDGGFRLWLVSKCA